MLAFRPTDLRIFVDQNLLTDRKSQPVNYAGLEDGVLARYRAVTDHPLRELRGVWALTKRWN
jgi:hypothetical protein